MRKIAVLTSLLGILFFSGISNNATKEILANDNTSVQETSEIINESSNCDSSFIKSDEIINETQETKLTEDQVEEIVKQISNKILGEELTDKLFATFGIGIVVILIVYVVFQVYERKKNSVSQKELSNASNENQNTIKEIKELNKQSKQQIDEYRDEIERLKVLNNKYVNDYKLLVKAVIETTEEATKILKEYSKFDNKLNVLLECVDLLSSTPDGVREGISSKIKEKVKGVKVNEQKES